MFQPFIKPSDEIHNKWIGVDIRPGNKSLGRYPRYTLTKHELASLPPGTPEETKQRISDIKEQKTLGQPEILAKKDRLRMQENRRIH